MPAGFTKSMAERLNELSQVQVKEASNGEVLKNGVVYIAPGGTHIAIKKSGASHVISFNDMPPISGLKPCANIMFDSLTSSNYDEVVCVVLTGMGQTARMAFFHLANQSYLCHCTGREIKCCVWHAKSHL